MSVPSKNSFVSSQGAPPKTKGGGKSMKIKRHPHPQVDQPVDPLRHASARIPKFATRHSHTNNKRGFHTNPAQPPSGRLAQRSGKPSRGSGHVNRAQL